MIQMGVTETHGQSPPFLPATASQPVPASISVRAKLQAGGMPGAADATIAPRTVSFAGILSGVCLSCAARDTACGQYCAGDAGRGKTDAPSGQGFADWMGLVCCAARNLLKASKLA